MKIKPKYLIICCCIVFAILVAINIISENQSQNVAKNQLKELALTYEYIDTNFYYEQLTSDEQEVYHKIIEQLDVYQGERFFWIKRYRSTNYLESQMQFGLTIITTIFIFF